MATAKIVVPVRYSAWLCGELGHQIQELLENALAPLGEVHVTRLPRALLVEADEDSGPLLEAAHRAIQDAEAAVAKAYPVFHHEMGPVWTGTLQAVFPQTPAQREGEKVRVPA